MAAGVDDALETRLISPRIAVLGPPAIGRPGSLRPLVGHAGRLLVALAASAAARTADELADVVWGDAPPRTYRSALHVHLGTVRRAVEDAGGRVVRAADAYELDRGALELDWALGLDLAERARRRLDSDPIATLRDVEAALELWRGPTFSVEGEIVDPVAHRHLEVVRRELEELRVEALLRTGNANAAEIAALAAVSVEPLHEERWGQLLRARYLAGRTADALATYQEARTTLVDQLGIEPGVELRELEAAALVHDTERLRLPMTSTPVLAGPPRSSGSFVGRDRELARVVAAAGTDGIVVLGAPGVGKTRLAAEAARRLGADATTWIEVAGSSDTRLHETAAHAAHSRPEGVVVFDGADLAPGVVSRAVAEVRRAAPDSGVIVTSRVPFGTGLAVLVLAPLDVPDRNASEEDVEASGAVQALRAALTELAPEACLDTAAVAQLARRSGGLPLCLRLTASAARALPGRTLVAQSPEVTGDAVDVATRAVAATLDHRTRAAFRDLSVVDGDFDLELTAAVIDESRDVAAEVVVALVEHGLLQARLDRRLPYRFPAPIRTVGRRLLAETGGSDRAADRLVDGCIARARELQASSPRDRDGEIATRLDDDLAHHRQALAHLVTTGDADLALTLVSRLEVPLYVTGRWVEKVELLDTALAIPGPPSVARSRALALRARPGPMHRFSIEHAVLAEAMARELGHEGLIAFARHLQSIGLWWLGHTDEAVCMASDAAEALARLGLDAEANEARKFLGVALVLGGDAEQGLAVQHDALGAVRAAGNPFAIAHNLSYLGHCYRFLGDDVAAAADWAEAAELYRGFGNRGSAIHVAVGRAEVLADRDETEPALRFLSEAVGLARASRTETYDPWAWTVALRVHTLVGDPESARACARRAATGLSAAPSGEAVRLARELAAAADAAGDHAGAARLVGFASSVVDRRELPFPSPAERERHSALAARLCRTEADAVDAGARCTLAEAAGDLLREPDA